MKDTYQSDRLRVKLVYAGETAQYELKGGTIENASFAMNGLYDPYLGAGGSQPSGYATLFAQYRQANVYGARIDVDIMNSDSTTDYEWEVGLIPYAANALVAASMETAREQPYSLWRQSGSARGGRPQVHLSQYMSIKKIQGESNIRQEEYYQVSGANPDAQYRPFWNVKMWAPQGATEPGVVKLQVAVKITFYCEFLGRLNTPPSLIDTLINEAKATGHWEELLRKKGIVKFEELDEPLDFAEVEEPPPPPKKAVPTHAPVIPPGMRLVKA